MKSRFSTLIGFVLMLAAFVSAQTVYNYKYSKPFPDANFMFGNGAHGVAVDPAGKVWVQLFTGKDSINTGAGGYKAVAPILVYNANGTPAAFSPIKVITVSGVADTLFAGNNRGMTSDKNGNIVITNNTLKSAGNIYRLNYKTGAGMNKVIPQATSGAAPAFDDLNEMFTACVLDATGPIRIFDNNFAFLGNVVDTSRGFSRTLAVSGSGNDVYFGGFTNNFITRYHSDNGSLGPYSAGDTIAKGLTVECFAWHPKTGYLWAGGGNATSGSNKAPYTDYSFYAFKPPYFNTPVDSFTWSSPNLLTNDPRPRGIAFSPSGDTVYVCAFNVSAEPCVQMFIGKAANPTVYGYKNSKPFPDANFMFGNGAHGVAVDPAGKVWVQLFTGKDSINTGAGGYKAVAPILVYNANGTPAAFSPIKVITVSGVADTLFAGNNRGMTSDKNGNIVITNNTLKSAGNIYRLNYKTGAGMNKVIPQATSGAAPAFDDLNEMFTACVLDATGPIRIFDNNFAFLGNVVDTSRGFSRTLAVSGSGNDVYFGGFTNNFITRYHSDNGSLGPYSAGDTIAKGLTVECFAWHPKTGYLWAGGGNATSGSNKAPYTDYSFYAFKAPNFAFPVDSFTWSSPNLLTNDPRPRGIAFSPSGDTVYVCAFNVSLEPCVQMLTGKSSLGVRRDEGIVVSDYQLMQNYPNPFNPSTKIKFTVASNVTASLKVYDILGKEVANLVEGEYAAGSYTVDFNAKNLSTGIYFYTLKTSNGIFQTKKMLLVK